MRMSWLHQTGTTSFTARKRRLRSGFGREKVIVIDSASICFTPPKRTRAMNAIRVLAGETW